MAHGSRRAVAAAIAGNSVVTLLKLGAFLVTGSYTGIRELLMMCLFDDEDFINHKGGFE